MNEVSFCETNPPFDMPCRIAIVVSHPIQHFCPLYRAIAQDSRVDLLVIFCERGAGPLFDKAFGRTVQWQDDILKGYEHTVIEAAPHGRPAAVVERLSAFRPNAVYCLGYHQKYIRAALRWARQRSIPTLITADSELLHQRSYRVRLLKAVVMPRILRNVDMYLTVGDENERYFEHYGAKRRQFHRMPFSIDSHYYDRILSEREPIRIRERKRLRIPEDAVAILNVGKFIPRKRQADLLKAFALIQNTAKFPTVLLLAGDGPDRTMLEEVARPVEHAVRFLGFTSVYDLPAVYLASDIYAHPSSHDPHPLAISEGLYCGLPAVVSDRVGSAGPTDDVQVGKNGLRYPSGDILRLAEALRGLVDNPEIRERAGQHSAEIGKSHAVDNCATQFVEGVMRAISNRRL